MHQIRRIPALICMDQLHFLGRCRICENLSWIGGSHIKEIIEGWLEMKTEQRKDQFRQLGLTIAYYRKLRGMTQGALADVVNLSRTHISNLEAPNMPVSISLEKLFDIADALNVPVCKLFDFRN